MAQEVGEGLGEREVLLGEVQTADMTVLATSLRLVASPETDLVAVAIHHTHHANADNTQKF